MPEPSNTLDDFPAESFTIIAFCESCHRQAALDRTRLLAGITIQQLRGRLRCSGCGSRETALRIVFTGAGGFHHGGG